VKIRGFRVELGEIESCLRRHPAIQDAVVLAREDSPGEKRLAAYLVAKNREMPGAMYSWSVAELRSHVEKDLPEFMVPAAFLTLAALPLTPNGKVDRRALPAPDQWAHGGYPLVGAGRPDRGTVYVPPRDAVEKQVAAIWADLLGVERVGVHDNFFELGGHSLLAMRMLARVQESCGKELPAVAVFCSPTVAQLALVLHGRMDVRPTAAVREIQPGGSKPPLFFVPSVGGKSVSYWSMVQHLGPDQPVLSIGFPDPEQPPRPFETFEDFALWCVEKIREARPVGPYSLVGYSFAGMLAYEVARQLQATGSEVRVLAILDTGPQRKQSFSRRLQYPGRVLMNVPLWITEHVLRTSLRDNAAQLKRSIKAWTRRGLALTGLIAAARVEVEDILRVEGLTPAYRKLLDHNLQLFRAYAPKPYPGRITLFRARARDLFHPADRDLGWGEFAAGGVEVNDVPGSHGALFRDPIMSGIGEQLAERLSKVT
jgi:thioesterase domain-containing protein